jgi:hypothetical protein
MEGPDRQWNDHKCTDSDFALCQKGMIEKEKKRKHNIRKQNKTQQKKTKQIIPKKRKQNKT